MNIRELLEKHDIHPKKRLGQNFLIAYPTVEKIVRTVAASSEDKVLEIGPGPGIIAKLLTDQAKFVAAVDPDKEMIRVMETEWGDIPNLHIIQGDILDSNLDKLLGPSKDPWIFVGNIPYNITSPLLFHFRKFRHRFKRGVLMIQKEVADRLLASPGTKEYGILTIAMQIVADIERAFNVSPSSFYPPPKVDSTVIEIEFLEKPRVPITDLDFFTTVVRAAFSTRRKKIKNALKQSGLLQLPAEAIESGLQAAGILDDSRAEELDIETFAKLARYLKGDQ